MTHRFKEILPYHEPDPIVKRVWKFLLRSEQKIKMFLHHLQIILINTSYQDMLSTQYRLRLEGICRSIASGTEVSIDDMIWAEKLAKANTSARGMLRTARKIARNPNDQFTNQLDIGDPDKEIRGFTSPEDVVEWFHEDRPDDWRQRD